MTTFTDAEKTNLHNLLKFNQLRNSLLGCWMVSEALSYRIIFRFPDDALLIISAENGVWLQIENPKSIKPSKHWIQADIKSIFVRDKQEEYIQDVLVEEIALRGKPILILPWEDWERILEQFDEGENEEYKDLFEQIKKIVNNETKETLWTTCEFAYGDSYLPKDCDYSRFEAFAEELEANNWIVIWNECCGTCANGSIQDARDSEPEKVDSPVFIIYGQNADRNFLPDGSIINFLFMADEKEKDFQLKLAMKYGFEVKEQGEYEDMFFLNPT